MRGAVRDAVRGAVGGTVVGTVRGALPLKVIRMSESQSREPGFESNYCRFEACAISFTPFCLSPLSCRSGE